MRVCGRSARRRLRNRFEIMAKKLEAKSKPAVNSDVKLMMSDIEGHPELVRVAILIGTAIEVSAIITREQVRKGLGE